MNKKWTIVSIICLIIITLSLLIIYSPGVPVKVSKAYKGNITQYIDQRAETSLPRIYKISMPFDGKIAPIEYPAGTIVKKDQIVAKIITDDLETQYQVALAKKEEIEEMIKRNDYNNVWNSAITESDYWISGMKKVVDIAQKKLVISENISKYAIKYRDSQILSGLGVSEIKKAEAEMEAAVKILDVENAYLTYSVTQILLDIFKMAPIYIDEVLSIKKINNNILQSQLKQAMENVNYSKRKLGQCALKSQIDGIILQRYVENERFLEAGTELLDIGKMDELEVTADVLSTDIQNVKSGDPVKISLEYFDENTFDGKVKTIDPQGFTKVSSLGVEEQRVNVKISIDKESFEKLNKDNVTLGYKYRVFTRIITSEKNNTLIIPRTALTKDKQGSWAVFQIQDGKAMPKKINIGLMNNEIVEVTEGLEEGDKVILAPQSNLQAGIKVSTIE